MWVGPGRDPQVAYLDARLLAVATSELGTTGCRIYESGMCQNVLGGERHGDIDPAALHRIVHTARDRDGAPLFDLGVPCEATPPSDGLCGIGRREPRPVTEAAPRGSFAIEADLALQWVRWQEPDRAGVLRRALYADDRYLLEAGTGPDGVVRVWIARGLQPYGLESVAPSAKWLADIEARISRVTAPRP
jgi:hypothetical protein